MEWVEQLIAWKERIEPLQAWNLKNDLESKIELNNETLFKTIKEEKASMIGKVTPAKEILFNFKSMEFSVNKISFLFMEEKENVLGVPEIILMVEIVCIHLKNEILFSSFIFWSIIKISFGCIGNFWTSSKEQIFSFWQLWSEGIKDIKYFSFIISGSSCVNVIKNKNIVCIDYWMRQ